MSGPGQIGHGGATPTEVAVFVDFENIRYSTINSFGREPDPIQWRDKALKYGLMAVARAYADFDQHPPQVRTRLDVAGFEAQHYPAKRTIDQSGREKLSLRSDLNFALDIINTALARPDIRTFLLFTGDKDFIRLVTTLRNRLGKRVIICGVPGSVSPDLVAAAGEEDSLQMTQSLDVDVQVIRAIDNYIRQLHDGFVPTQSHMSRTLWRFLDRTILPSEHIEAKVMEFLRKGILTKRQTVNGQGQELVTTELNPVHPLVQEALPGYKRPVDLTDDDLGPVDIGLPEDEDEDLDEYEEDEHFEAEDEGFEEDEEAAEDGEEEYADEAAEDDFEEEVEDNRGNLIEPVAVRGGRGRTSSAVR
jgi:uncharacterized LabA/DUF88 family protein